MVLYIHQKIIKPHSLPANGSGICWGGIGIFYQPGTPGGPNNRPARMLTGLIAEYMNGRRGNQNCYHQPPPPGIPPCMAWQYMSCTGFYGAIMDVFCPFYEKPPRVWKPTTQIWGVWLYPMAMGETRPAGPISAMGNIARAGFFAWALYIFWFGFLLFFLTMYLTGWPNGGPW